MVAKKEVSELDLVLEVHSLVCDLIEIVNDMKKEVTKSTEFIGQLTAAAQQQMEAQMQAMQVFSEKEDREELKEVASK